MAKPVLQHKISSYCLPLPDCTPDDGCSFIGADCLPEYCRCDFGSADCGDGIHCVNANENWLFASGQRYCLKYTTNQRIANGILGAVAVAGVLIVAPELAPAALDAATEEGAAAVAEDASATAAEDDAVAEAGDVGDAADDDAGEDDGEDADEEKCKSKFPKRAMQTIGGLAALAATAETVENLATSNASVLTDIKQCANSFACGFAGGVAFAGFGGMITAAACTELMVKFKTSLANQSVQSLHAEQKKAFPCVMKHENKWISACRNKCINQKKPSFTEFPKVSKACFQTCFKMNNRKSVNSAFVNSIYTKCGFKNLGSEIAKAPEAMKNAKGQNGVCNMLGLLLGQKILANSAKTAAAKLAPKDAGEAREAAEDEDTGNKAAAEAEDNEAESEMSEVDKESLACT